MKITLEQVKHQCRIDHDDEDELLESYMAAAYDYVERFTSVENIEPSPAINQACLMLVAHWYANREATANNMVVAKTPFGVDFLLQPYRRMGV